MNLRNLLPVLLVALFSAQAQAQTKSLPLWELGVGVLPLRLNHYRGSPEQKNYLFPLVAYTYRGKNVEAESGYVRGHIVKFEKFTIDLSFSLGINSNSDSNGLRERMPNLDPTFELGPMLRYYLWKSTDGKHFINLEMPYRAVFTTNLQYIDHLGYYSIPYVNYLNKGTDETFGWTSEVSLGIQYGSSGFHNHFFAVNSNDVTPKRSYYHASSGYSGAQLALVLSKRIKDFLLVPFLRYDYLDGAVYNKSPLYKSPHYTMYGMSLIWYFSKSDRFQTAPTMVK